MATSETVKMEIGYEDDGTIIFVEMDKENIPLARKALAYLYKQEQEEKKKNEGACTNLSQLQILAKTGVQYPCEVFSGLTYFKKLKNENKH